MCTINEARSRPFGPDGCQVPCGSGICGETRTLQIINEFKKLYEEKMQQIDTAGGGDYLQDKIKLQQEWIGDLTEQNEMLVSAVEELEHEATERVHLLEEKLHLSGQSICEVMKKYREYDVTNDLLAEPLQKVFWLENDRKNLLEFIRRNREENRWDVDGLTFFTISYQDLLGPHQSEKDYRDIELKNEYINSHTTKGQAKLKEKGGVILELQGKLDYFHSFGNVQCLADELKDKKEECDSLKKSMEETKHALVAEIASKHDIIVQLKTDCQQLEERCIQADKHTAFRDDIIKELRKEIKQLKQQGGHELLRQENQSLLEKVTILETEIQLLNNIKNSVGHVQEKQSQTFDNNHQSIHETQGLVKELGSITENLDANEHMISVVANEITLINRCIEVKDAQLREQLELIKVLVSKLFNVDKGLQYLEQRAASIKCFCAEQQVESLQFKVQVLEKQNCCLEGTICEDKCQIENLEKQFQIFLKDKEELKHKAKCRENKCKQLLDEKEKLTQENEGLKVETANLKKCNLLFKNELKYAEEELENLKSKATNCDCILEQLKEEKDKLINEMVALNEENRNLLKSIESLKKRTENTRKLTQDEIVQLNTTIDELQSGLQKTKELQENEEKRYQEIISQLSRTVQDLSCDIRDVEEKYEKTAKVCKICKGRSKIQFAENAEVQTCLDEEELQHQMEVIQNKEEIIKVQGNTLNLLQLEVQTLKLQESELREDRDSKCQEIQDLKNRIVELESAMEDCEGKAANLQLAVDLYLNSINVLEASEEKYKIEINQQKSTISNLQSALVATKQELDEIKQKSEENEQEQHSLINSLNVIMSEAEHEKQNLVKQYECITDGYEHLQDLNFDLEVEHCNSLQDVDLLENQLFKYQSLLKSSEEENRQYKHHLKKFVKQKKCYEEVILYFKQEMGLMSEQLINLQELLTLSNESTQEETCKLMQAFTKVQTLNETLSTQLIAAEQKVALENQMNLLQEAKIDQLQQLISDREIDLTRHDQAIMNIRQTLQCSLKQNEELHITIGALNDTIVQLQCAVGTYETENCRCKENTQICQSQITSCKQKLDELKTALDKKTADLLKLEMAYNHQNRYLKSTQMELKEMKDRQKDKQCHMKCTIQELRTKLGKSEENYSNLCKEFTKLQNQLANIARKETVKDQEVKRYRTIVCDLKQTLIELNKSLTNRDLQKAICKNEECRKNMELTEEARNLDICLNCPCEVEFYQSIVETLKKSVIDLKKRLTDTQKKNKQLEEDGKHKEAMLAEIAKSQSQKEKEYKDLRHKLTEKLRLSQAEEAHYQEMAKQFQKEQECIRKELEVKTLQLNELKKGALEMNSSRCVQLAHAQEEVNILKEELNNILRKHCALNAENERLHNQSACMQATVSALEEKSELLKDQLEQYLAELQSVQHEKDAVIEKNCELLSELRSIQSACTEANKQQRYTNESVKVLESELIEVKNSRDDMCFESKNVISYVNAWLQEQRKINEHIVRRERNYCNTIHLLKQEYEELQCHYAPQQQRAARFLTPCLKSTSPPQTCQSPWSLGSQGTASMHDIDDSPSGSPCLNEEADWYCPNFRVSARNESEDDEEEDWVSKVEHLAAQVRKTNKMWKNKMGQSDYTVSKDTKK